MTGPRNTIPAMGASATVLVDGPSGLLDVARRRLADLEAKWSRFRPDSEISRLNGARTTGREVSADTRLLVRCGITAWERTAGAFDPSVHDAVVAWGYDRDLDEVRRHRPPRPEARPAPGLSAVAVDDAAGTVDLGGVGFDPGGIAKGLAADLVATELVQGGASAALVNVSGDLRVAGTPSRGGWTVGLEDPLHPDQDLARMRPTGGGVATSSTGRRRWTLADGTDVHHLLDPGTGAPATPALAGVSVLAGEAWWAEALTKAVLVGAVPVDRLGELGASGIGRRRTGELVGTADLLDLVRGAA